jgi:VIT1/CCC1 family predicted Fe2+/Mn2+ transporter
MPRLKRLTDTSEAGSASLEFITAGLILLVPLVYLVLALSALQGGALAVEGAARQAARVYVQSPDDVTATARAHRAVAFALQDYGLDPRDADVRIDCANGATRCLSGQGLVTVTVRIGVVLPLVPDLLALDQGASVPIMATSTQIVSRFGGTG